MRLPRAYYSRICAMMMYLPVAESVAVAEGAQDWQVAGVQPPLPSTTRYRVVGKIMFRLSHRTIRPSSFANKQ